MGTGIGTSLYNLPMLQCFTNPLLNPGLATSSGTSGFAQFLAGVSGGPSAAIAAFPARLAARWATVRTGRLTISTATRLPARQQRR